MKILITGVCGLIGSHLTDELLSIGHEVIGLDNLSFGNKNNIKQALTNKNFKYHDFDVSDSLFDFGKVDVVFHLAAYKKAPKNSIDSSDVMLNNVNMIKSVTNYVKEYNSTLIFTSTSDIYGNSNTFSEDESITIGPPNVERYSYAMSKFFDEQFLLNLVSENKIQCVIPRIFGCFSERSNRSWSGGHLPLFIANALNGDDIIIHGDGKQTRSMSYVSDIVDGLVGILNNRNKLNGEIINIGSSEEMSVIDSAKLIVELCNSNSNIIFVDGESVYGRYDEIKRRFANITKAKDTIDYKTNYTTIQGIERVINDWK